MRSRILTGSVLVVMLVLLMSLFSGCFSNSTSTTPITSSDEALMPQPVVEKVIATTSGTDTAYYATLDIKIKNEGAEGIILVIGRVTQAGQSTQREMPVFLKEGKSHELKLTFPLIWKGGEFTSSVETIVP